MCVSIQPGSSSKKLNIEVNSDFHLEDARQVGAALANAAAGTDVDIDFREVQDCDGPALAFLVDAIRPGRVHVALHGTSGHVRKLLVYLGAAFDPRSADMTAHQ
jgi:ABC-type transporter Mla MlaB component